MTRPFPNVIPTLDDINAMRQSVKKDIKATGEHSRKRKAWLLSSLFFSFISVLLMLNIRSIKNTDPASPMYNYIQSTLPPIMLLMIILIITIVTCVLLLIFKRAPKPTCTHHYSLDDLTATSDEHQAQNSNLIDNDNQIIQQYVSAVKTQDRALYKFELKHFSDILNQ